MNRLDHYTPNAHYKNYLDATGKYTGNTPCVCKDCKQRRSDEAKQKIEHESRTVD